jgi:hypothetical protein
MSVLDCIDYSAFGMFRPGTRVVLTDDVGFFDKGDRGRVLFNGVDEAECLAFVQFDGGARNNIPIFALAEDHGCALCGHGAPKVNPA